MKLTDVERTILYRLHEVLAELQPDDAKDHKLKMDILLSGYHEQRYEFALSDPLPDQDAKFVYDVLDLYRGLNASYEELSKKDREGIDKTKLHFPGFDGNNETNLMGYAQFLIRKLGHWAELKAKADYNSHRPMRDLYARMLSAAKKLRFPSADYSADEISSILDARVHPSKAKAG